MCGLVVCVCFAAVRVWVWLLWVCGSLFGFGQVRLSLSWGGLFGIDMGQDFVVFVSFREFSCLGAFCVVLDLVLILLSVWLGDTLAILGVL